MQQVCLFNTGSRGTVTRQWPVPHLKFAFTCWCTQRFAFISHNVTGMLVAVGLTLIRVGGTFPASRAWKSRCVRRCLEGVHLRSLMQIFRLTAKCLQSVCKALCVNAVCLWSKQTLSIRLILWNWSCITGGAHMSVPISSPGLFAPCWLGAF